MSQHTVSLTPTQQAVLTHAIQHSDGRIEWFPDIVKGGARQKVLSGLFNRALITPDGQQGWWVAAEGYDALGVPRPCVKPAATKTKPAPATSAQTALTASCAPRSPRQNTKQAQVIALLQRPEGVSIAQIMQATGWQAHSVRGALSGMLRKKLGLAITSHKESGGERVYRIDAAD